MLKRNLIFRIQGPLVWFIFTWALKSCQVNKPNNWDLEEILDEVKSPESLNLWCQDFQPRGPSVVFLWRFNSSQLIPPFWIGTFYKKELEEYFNPRTVSDDFHDEIGEEELREEVVDEEALETGIKGDQER